MDRDELIHEVGALIVRNPKVAAEPWDSYALIVRIDNDQSKLNGFAYTGDIHRPVTPKGFDLHDKLAALREATRVPGKDPWGACVIRIQRSTGSVKVDFEYDAPDQWTVTPKNADEIAQRARP